MSGERSSRCAVRVLLLGREAYGHQGLNELLLGPSSELVRVVGFATSQAEAYRATRQLAQFSGVPTFTRPEDEKGLRAWAGGLGAECAFVMEWAHKLSPDLLHLVDGPFLNFHPSALPHGRGGAPLEDTILGGRQLVMTCHHVSTTFDSGPIAAVSEPWDVEGMPLALLYQLSSHLASRLLRRVVRSLSQRRLEARAQDEAARTYRWYKDLDARLAIGCGDSIDSAARKILAANPKHGLPLAVRVGARVRRLRVSSAVVVKGSTPRPSGHLIDASAEGFRVALHGGFLAVAPDGGADPNGITRRGVEEIHSLRMAEASG